MINLNPSATAALSQDDVPPRKPPQRRRERPQLSCTTCRQKKCVGKQDESMKIPLYFAQYAKLTRRRKTKVRPQPAMRELFDPRPRGNLCLRKPPATWSDQGDPSACRQSYHAKSCSTPRGDSSIVGAREISSVFPIAEHARISVRWSCPRSPCWISLRK